MTFTCKSWRDTDTYTSDTLGSRLVCMLYHLLRIQVIWLWATSRSLVQRALTISTTAQLELELEHLLTIPAEAMLIQGPRAICDTCNQSIRAYYEACNTVTVEGICTPEYSKTRMDEWKPLSERRVAVSKTPDGFVQRSCSLPIIRPCAVPEQLPVYVPCHIRRKPIADRPHRPNHSPVTCKQHPSCDMDGLIGEMFVTHSRLTCGEKSKTTTRT